MEKPILSNFKSNLKELYPAVSVGIVIHRFVEFTGGTNDGVSPDRKNNDEDIPMRARVYAITQQDVLNSNGFYVIGDVKTKTISDIVGYNSDPENKKQGDRMTYDGTYFGIKGRPVKKQMMGGRVETECLWRRL